jgi:hypothetical protein
MDKLIYISPLDIGNINELSSLRNNKTFSKYIDPIDYHFTLFSTLYQSGVNFFETEEKLLPNSLKDYKFWKNKLTPLNVKAYDKAILKTRTILEGKLHFEADSAKTRRLEFETVALLSNIFYSLETGIPFINTNYSLAKHLGFMKERMDKDLLHSLHLLSSLIVPETIQTITPKYSVLKEDINRFEDISNSRLFASYSNSLNELQYSSKYKDLKKDISVKSLKLFGKYSSNINIKETAFSFLKFNKSIIDLFISKIPSLVGDFVITSFEKLSKEKRKVSFYEIEEARYSTLFCNIFDDTLKDGGMERLNKVIDELKKELESLKNSS